MPDVAGGAGLPGDARRALAGFVPPPFAAEIASAARRLKMPASGTNRRSPQGTPGLVPISLGVVLPGRSGTERDGADGDSA